MYHEKAASLPLAEDLCRHMAWLEHTVITSGRIQQLKVDGVEMGVKIKEQHNEQFAEM